MSTWELYFFLILPQLGGFLGVLAGLGGLGSIVLIVISFVSENDSYYNEEQRKHRKIAMKEHRRKLVPVLVISLFLAILVSLIPTTRIMLALLAWELGSNVEGLSELPASSVEYLQELIQSELNEMRREQN